MFSIALLKTVLLFLFGAPHKVMYTAMTFTGVNMILDFFRRYEPPKTKKQVLKDFFKRLLAYIAFVVIGARLDSLMVDSLFGWEGSTQMLVCLYIAGREIRIILDYIRQQGIDVPLILEQRAGQMERTETQAQGEVGVMGFREQMYGIHNMPTASTDPAEIDAKIMHLKNQIESMEVLRKVNEGQNTTGGEHK